MTVELDYSDITFEIEYHYVPYNPGDYNNPPEGGYAMIENIFIKEVSVINVIAPTVMAALEHELLENELDKN